MFNPMTYIDLTDPKIIIALVVIAGLARWSRIWGIRRRHLDENQGYIKVILVGLFCALLAMIILF
jgi:hypothetical protein